MRLRDLNWMDVERYLEYDDRIILLTGSTEQHAYLSLLTDVLIPERIADAAVEVEPVLIAPPLNFGMSPLFKLFPGTVDLRYETFSAVLEDVIGSFRAQGFQRFFILNGHGGNEIPAKLEQSVNAEDFTWQWYDWWRSDSARKFARSQGLEINHANWGENFPFNRVAESPSGVKEEIRFAELHSAEAAKARLGDGNFGGEYQVSDELSLALFQTVVDEVVELLRVGW